ncbi:MAG: family 10 glycosylhydrolase [Defluviitaleaceae bacterium]|nr:family 10 glycosylhydrolase [Defluviitaleaceae bacterium]
MKKIAVRVGCFILTIIITLALIPPVPLAADRPASQSHQMRGVWVTSAYNLDWPSRQNLTAAQMRSEIDTILYRAAQMGLNAVFVQVRPTADSLFPSEIFPWSSVLTGVAGQVPAFYAVDGFDPLAYWIERGHALGIEVHAWLNPFRISHRMQNITSPSQLPTKHPARVDSSLAIYYNNALFLDPGNPAARQLIIDGVAEILRNYPNIDGIHFDDYFYPSRNFPDAATFARYGGGFSDIDDWRRDNVNQMIQEVQTIVRQINPRVRWGVSPTAIWMNDDTDPRGSATGGSESYHRAYADTRRWVMEEWIDYIAPQIYWIEGFAIACYDVVLSWWEDVVRGTNVNLYVGMAPYREVLRYTDPRFSNWTEHEIVRQLERNSRSNDVNGAIFFRHNFIRGAVGDDIARFYAGVIPEAFTNAPLPMLEPPSHIMTRLTVAQPPASRSINDAANFSFFGTAIPDLPLYVNGAEVVNRTAEGFFSIFLPLDRGENTFTFTQPGQPDVVRVITNNTAAIIPLPTMTTPNINTVYPAINSHAQHGSEITLRANAPAGATVTASVGNQTVELTQVNPNHASTANRIYATAFSGQLTLDAPATADAIIDLGHVIYTAHFQNQTFNAVSDGRVFQLGAEAPLFAEIIAPAAWAFPGTSTAAGSSWKYVQGQTDRVTAITQNWWRNNTGLWTYGGDWTRLASGFWVESENIERRTATPAELYEWFPPLIPQAGILSEGRHFAGEVEDRIIWNAPVFPAMYAEFDGTTLTVALGMQSATPPPIFLIGDNAMIQSYTVGEFRGAPAYFMTLRTDTHLEGFYIEYVDGEVHLVLRRRRALTPGPLPLYGFDFVLDAGHGGTDPGAVGPMGGDYAEKHIVMDVTWKLAERLEMLGATVHLVRDGDYNVPLIERADLSREVKPDMFISIHSNSTAETTNATNIHGLTMWYRNPNSAPAAQTFFDNLRFANPLSNRANHINQANFFVCRAVWAPSILVELSFTNNIQDFAWMINPNRQIDMAWGMVNAILAYYR